MVLPVWAIFLINLAVSIALAPKPKKPRAAAIEDFDVPTADQDRPIPVLFGTKRITGPNVVWYGDLSSRPIKKGNIFGSSVIGYRYYLGMHIALGVGPVDEMTRIETGDKEAWTGTQSANGTISINAPELYGGEQREGGIVGDVDVLLGASSQTANAYLESAAGTPQPGYRGIVSLVWKGGYLGNTPYIKPWAVTAKRILAGWEGGSPWYSAKAEVPSGGMNAAHIIYQCLTDTEWGQGAPVDQIDDTNFRAVADTLYDEDFGLDLLWNQESQVDDFIQIVVDHIGAALAFNRATNQYQIILIRGDYDPDLLETFGPGEISLESRQRRLWAECVNELTLSYTDPTTLKRTSVTVQDLGNIQAQGARIHDSVDLPGITSRDKAIEVAGRELDNRSTPLQQIRFSANRELWEYGAGSVVKIEWPPLNIPPTVFRLIKVGLGTLEDGTLSIEAVEDIYALDPTTYAVVELPDAEPAVPATPFIADSSPNILGEASSPPSGPADGDRYFIPNTPTATGDFAGQEGSIGEWNDGAGEWFFVDVPAGAVLYNEDTGSYFTTDGAGGVSNPDWPATLIGYDNSSTGMSSTNVQAAIDELFQLIGELEPESDPLFANVILLLRSQNGIHGQTSFFDESEDARTLTTGGQTIFDNGQSKLSDVAILFDGSGNDEITVPDHADFDFSDRTVEFCIEAWFYSTDLAHANTIFNGRDSSSAEEYTLRTAGTAMGFWVWQAGSNLISVHGGSLAENTWYHVAITRELSGGNGILRLFIDGILVDSDTQTDNGTTNTNAYQIGHNDFNSSRDFEGYIDSLRITRGDPRYVGNFSVPTTPFPAQ